MVVFYVDALRKVRIIYSIDNFYTLFLEKQLSQKQKTLYFFQSYNSKVDLSTIYFVKSVPCNKEIKPFYEYY